MVSWSYLLDGILFSIVPSTVYLINELVQYAPIIFAVNSIAFMLGSLTWGLVADRVGRRVSLITSLLIYIVSTILYASLCWVGITNPSLIIIITSLINFGVGAEVGPSYSILAELIPSRHRGKALMLATNFWNVGAALIASVSLWYRELTSNIHIALLYTFVTAIFLSLIAILMRLHMPESPRWLLTRGRVNEAVNILKLFLGTTEMPPQVVGVSLRTAFVRYRLRLMILLISVTSQLLTYNIVAYYLPYSEGFVFGVATAPLIIALSNIGASLGALPLIPIIDSSRKLAMLASFSGGLLTGLSITLAHMYPHWNAFALGLILNMVFAEWAWASVVTLESELFPTGVRASLAGFITGFAWSTNSVIVYLENVITAQNLLILTDVLWGLGLAAAVIWVLYGIESAKKTLEELSR